MSTAAYISAFAAAVALGAALLSWRAARGTDTRNAFDLARSLYNELTSDKATASRSALEFYRRAESRSGQQTAEILDHYFALLWRFEHVLAGRESLEGQRRLNGTRPKIDYLDRMIKWHVEEWAARWQGLRDQIKEHIPNLDDHHSLEKFCELADRFPEAAEHVRALQAVIEAERAAYAGT